MKELSRWAAAAKAIRKELGKAFPETKFQVRSESYSMGSSVDVDWTDGPTTDMVEEIIKKYQYGHFNGMEDLYEYSNTREDIPQVKFVMTQREISEESTFKFAQVIAKDYGLEPPKSKEELGKSFDHDGQWYNWYQLVRQYVWKLDLTGAETIKHIERYCGSPYDCYEAVRMEG